MKILTQKIQNVLDKCKRLRYTVDISTFLLIKSKLRKQGESHARGQRKIHFDGGAVHHRVIDGAFCRGIYPVSVAVKALCRRPHGRLRAGGHTSAPAESLHSYARGRKSRRAYSGGDPRERGSEGQERSVAAGRYSPYSGSGGADQSGDVVGKIPASGDR